MRTQIILSAILLMAASLLGSDRFVALPDSYVAIVTPLREAVISSAVTGNVGEYQVADGVYTEKGAVIVTLDDREYQSLAAKAKAVFNEAVAQYNYSQKMHEGNLALAQKQMCSEQELARTQLELELAAAKRDSAKADYDNALLELEQCTITMPFAGRIVERFVKSHEFVRPGMPLLSILDDTQVYAVVFLPLHYRSALQLEQTLYFQFENVPGIFAGKVEFIAPKADAATGNFEVRARIDNSQGLLVSGMSGELLKDGAGE